MYFAITRQHGRWISICSGSDPDEVYLQAMDIISSQDQGVDGLFLDDGPLALSPAIERQLDALRVVTEEAARETYQVLAPA
jgi:hypothetical protein